jgi:hypothetical protein
MLMVPEAELVGVGVSCVEKGLFGSEIIASDRDTRDALHPDIVVCVGKEEYVLEDDKAVRLLGEEDFITKSFTKTSAKDACRPDSVEACTIDAKAELDGETVGVEAEAQNARDLGRQRREQRRAHGSSWHRRRWRGSALSMKSCFPKPLILQCQILEAV